MAVQPHALAIGQHSFDLAVFGLLGGGRRFGFALLVEQDDVVGAPVILRVAVQDDLVSFRHCEGDEVDIQVFGQWVQVDLTLYLVATHPNQPVTVNLNLATAVACEPGKHNVALADWLNHRYRMGADIQALNGAVRHQLMFEFGHVLHRTHVHLCWHQHATEHR